MTGIALRNVGRFSSQSPVWASCHSRVACPEYSRQTARTTKSVRTRPAVRSRLDLRPPGQPTKTSNSPPNRGRFGPEDSSSGTETWLYDGTVPGPELRVREGDVLQADVTNELPEETTVHWHGVPVPNSVDGVPDVTQEPISNGETFTYKYRAEPSGTYLYHSHVGLQFDRALVGPLVIEENLPTSSTTGSTRSSSTTTSTRSLVCRRTSLWAAVAALAVAMAGWVETVPAMAEEAPVEWMEWATTDRPTRGMLMNGRLPSNAPAFDVADGERVRFRFINGGGATTFRVRLAATSSRSRTPTVGLSNRSTSIPSTWGPGSATTQ